jgi:hypothetical protein
MLKQAMAVAAPAGLLAALLVAPPAASAPTGGQAVQARAASAYTEFKDGAGDSRSAPDITDVSVGNDAVTGAIVMWITVANRTGGLTGDDDLLVPLDVDRNPATGDEDGADYLIAVGSDSVGLGRLDATQITPVDAASLKARFSRPDRAVRLEIHPRELSETRAFDFWVITLAGEQDLDLAPNGPPAWSYQFATTALRLAVAGFGVSPRAPVAGRPFAAALRVVRSDLLETLTLGKVKCTLKLGRASIRATRSGFLEGVPYCAWKLPRSSKGKTLRGTISVTYGGKTATRAFSVKAR